MQIILEVQDFGHVYSFASFFVCKFRLKFDYKLQAFVVKFIKLGLQYLRGATSLVLVEEVE